MHAARRRRRGWWLWMLDGFVRVGVQAFTLRGSAGRPSLQLIRATPHNRANART